MIFASPTCPECGEPPRGTVERLSGCAVLFQAADGHFEYEGDTDIWWDEQETIEDEDGSVELICAEGHMWYSAVDHTPASPQEATP